MNTSISLTIYDIVSYLFPGAAFLLSLQYFSGVGKTFTEAQTAIFLLVFGYLVGVILHLFGHLLYKGVYKEDYPDGSLRHKIIAFVDFLILKSPLLRIKRADTEVKKELAKVIEKKLNLDFNGKRLNLYSFADTYVAALPFQERDLLMAKEGLLRSMTALVIVEMMYFYFFILPQYHLFILFFGLLLTELLRYGREYHRIIKNQQIYTLTLIKLKQ